MTVRLVTDARQPFAVDAWVVEDDTASVLSARCDVLRGAEEHPVRLMTALYDDVPCSPGTVVVGRRHPFRMLALVHDFDQEPSFRPTWVSEALVAVWGACEARQVRCLAMEPLGCRYGGLSTSDFRLLLQASIAAVSPLEHLRDIWLLPG